MGDLKLLASAFTELARSGIRACSAKVSAEAQSLVKLGFRNSVDPYGAPWAPLKHRDGMPLRDTGRLANSFTFTPVEAGGVTIGTPVVYAAAHQDGASIQRKAQVNAHAKNGRFMSRKKAAAVKRGTVRISIGKPFTIKVPQRMMLPTPERGLGTWKGPIQNAIKRTVKGFLK